MKTGDRVKSIALLTGISFVIVSFAVVLTDYLFLKNISIHWLQVVLMALISSILLTPLFYWLRLTLENGGIEATQLSNLELNERDVREAVSNWVYIHYNKKVEGGLEFSRDDSGVLNCKVTVRNDS
ncbi:hypothetical protein EXM22_17710 [Oceanispirochaeta crateris]|uniref:Uncharacterized protein n=1 Tax=Oceanispirochaeta crateris TaxID=2518645 RepID=A0A5C1QQ57_9SPIO|nr:hypothetical protein [Oceanispirochaeta crateris]QEN09731.1 hypothetical protein EXM22_17710 [Oceanispirochaeta crateris]